MPWREVTSMSLRKELVVLSMRQGANISILSQRFGISRKTAYKWLQRYRLQGDAGLLDQSKRPRKSPDKTPAPMEEAILNLRDQHPAWGGRKLRHILESVFPVAVPSPSTITNILRRNGRIDPAESLKHTAWQRFEAPAPNELWQMDFKGHFPVANGRCHPLTVLDDHSRYALCLEACADERHATVKKGLIKTFRCYGLPRRILVDNGSPWGSDSEHPHTALTVWLMRLGVGITHSRPRHPQTLGKDERFHRTLKAEILGQCRDLKLSECQPRFDSWRTCYNLERPHEALGMAAPVSRYKESPRSFPEKLPELEYAPGDIVRKVQDKGILNYRSREYKVGKAFVGQHLALRPTLEDGILEVLYGWHTIGRIDLNQRTPGFQPTEAEDAGMDEEL